MKKIPLYILLGFLVYLTLGASCEERLVELPVLGSVEYTFSINSSNNSYNDTDTINFAEEVERLREENAFEGIRAIAVESITYTILNNESAAAATINGVAQVSATSFASMVTLYNMTGLNLSALENIEQKPTLTEAGVGEINDAIDIETGTNEVYFSINGTVTPAPPPNVNFDILVKITFTVIGQVKVDVPVI